MMLVHWAFMNAERKERVRPSLSPQRYCMYERSINARAYVSMQRETEKILNSSRPAHMRLQGTGEQNIVT